MRWAIATLALCAPARVPASATGFLIGHSPEKLMRPSSTTAAAPIHSTSRRSSRQSPEILGKAEAREDRLVLVTDVWSPVGIESITPPRVGEFAQLRDAQRGAWFPTAEPSRHMLLRPEEVHRASGEDDVVPPGGRGNEAVEEQAFVAGSRGVYLALDGLMAVRA